MAKQVIAVSLDEETVAKLNALGGNRSDLVQQALESWLGRPPTDRELAEALAIVFRAAQLRRGEEVS